MLGRGDRGDGEAMEETTVKEGEEKIDEDTDAKAKEGTTKDVAGIVKSEVDAGIAAESGPKEYSPGYGMTAEIECDEGPSAEGICCMGGDEAIETTATVVHEIHQPFKSGLVGWAKTVEEWFTEAAGETVGDEDDQSKASNEQEHLPPMAVLKKDIEKDENEGNPRGSRRDGEHHVVQPSGIAAVEGEEELLVGMEERSGQGEGLFNEGGLGKWRKKLGGQTAEHSTGD